MPSFYFISLVVASDPLNYVTINDVPITASPIPRITDKLEDDPVDKLLDEEDECELKDDWLDKDELDESELNEE